MKKRIISLLLAISLLCSMLPGQVLAAEGNAVYLNAEAYWPSSQYDYAVWAWPSGGEGHWVLPQGSADSSGWVTFQVDESNLLFVALRKGAAADWGNKAHQTVDLTLDTSKPYFILTSTTGGKWEEDSCTHQWSSQVTVQPSCTATGTEVFTCALCGDSYEQTLSRTAHNWQGESCVDCGTVKNMVYLSAEHMFPDAEYDWYAWVWPMNGDGRWVAPSSAQTMAGFTAFPVEDNDYGVIFAIFSQGQEPVWDTQICQTDDLTVAESRCYYTLCSHTYGSTHVAQVATMTEACNHSWDIINQTHANCTQFGITDLTCSLCQLTSSLGYPPTGHSTPPAQLEIITPPTCVTAGTMGYTCETCQQVVTVPVGATGHSAQPEELTVVTLPTCTQNGLSTYVCETCQETVNVTVSPLGHTLNADGVCTVCGASTVVIFTNPDGGVNEFATMMEAIEFAAPYDGNVTLTLQKDCTWTLPGSMGVINQEQNLTLDLNGHCLTLNFENYNWRFQLASVQIKNGELCLINGGKNFFNFATPKVTLEDITITQGTTSLVSQNFLVEEGVYTNAEYILRNVTLNANVQNVLYAENGTVLLENCTFYTGTETSIYQNSVQLGSKSTLTLAGEGRYHYLYIAEYSFTLRSCLEDGLCLKEIGSDQYAKLDSNAAQEVELAPVPLVPSMEAQYETVTNHPVTITPGYTANIEGFDPDAVTYEWGLPTDIQSVQNQDGGVTVQHSEVSDQVLYLTFGYKGYTVEKAIGVTVNSCTAHEYDNGICRYCGGSQPLGAPDGEGFYHISNAGMFLSFVDMVNTTTPGASARLTADIDLTDLSVVPMRTQDVPYTGTFDGQGYSLLNLSCIGQGEYWALFAQAENATIQNLGVTGTVRNNKSQGSNTAGILAFGRGCTLRNCWTDLTVEGGTSVAGITIYLDENSLIENCRAKGVVRCATADTPYGNLAGIVESSAATIRNCTNEADVTALEGFSAAGIIINASGTIENCVNKGNISVGTDSDAAGIVSTAYNSVRGCVNLGAVTAGDNARVGGIAGITLRRSESVAGHVENCINRGAVTGGSGAVTYVGGIIAEADNNPVQSCVNLGAVTAGDNARVGGIAGYARGEADILYCGNQGSVTGGASTHVGGILGYSDGGTVENSYNAGTLTSDTEALWHPIGRAGYSNCVYLPISGTEANTRTPEQFASGQVAYELNGSTTTEESIWRQTLGTDSYPTLSGALVYYGETYRCDGTSLGEGYSNSALGTRADHTYGEHGLCSVCRHSSIPAEDTDGDGYVEIDTAAKLWWFTQQVKAGQNDLNAELTANIDLSGTCGEGIGNWLPIGNSYSGRFDGKGFTISNLYMTGDEQYVGLFGYVKGATIENVTVTGSVSSTFSWTLDESAAYYEGAAGGIAACLYGGTIRNCHVDMTVIGELEVGGICGILKNDSIIENCTSRGSVVSPGVSGAVGQAVGGIVGNNWNGTVRGCINQARVSTKCQAHLGGIAGVNFKTVENCLNQGAITSENNTEYEDTAGGIVGSNAGIIRNCGNQGAITVPCGGMQIGGIVGLHQGSWGPVENCYNIGTITTGDGTFGSVSGATSADAALTNNYYLSDTTTEDGGRTAEAFASGEVAYALNGSTTTEESIWRQTIGTETYPAFSGALVYCVSSQKCDGTVLDPVYSNTSEPAIVHEDADNNSFCDLCNWLIITEITFPDETFRNIILSDGFDMDQDGLLSPEEIARVTNLMWNRRGLTDITGINYFTELTEFWATDNSFTSLDLSGLSKLETLILSPNLNLTSLNLEGCTSLTELHLDGCFSLESLNLEDCTALTRLGLSGCSKLADSLDVSHLTELTYLNVNQIYLLQLDLSANTKLEELLADDTGLTSLDLSKNTALYRLEADTQRVIHHCGVGYVNMNLYGDVTKMINITGGTMGENGWLELDDDAYEVCYAYVTGAEGCDLFVTIGFHPDSVLEHNFADRIANKDESQHYTKMCQICCIYEEASLAPCVYDDECDTECNVCHGVREITHSYDNDCDTDCNICGEIRTVTHPYVNGFCTACGGYEEPLLVDGVCQIANGGNLFWLAQAVNGGESDAKAILTDHIDLENRQWTPIRDYTGTFDGAGHSISGFAITEYNSETLLAGEKAYIGLFGSIQSPAVVKNFTLDGRIVLNEGGTGSGFLGAVVAVSGQDNRHNGGTITGITSNVTLITGAGYTLSHGGGVAGALYGGTISQCIFNGSLSSNGGGFNEAGGVVGYCQDTLIENCGFYGSVSVTGTNHAGGILGYVNNAGAIIRNNLSFGSVSGGKAQYTGAIIGRANDSCVAANGYNNFYSTDKAPYGIGSGSTGIQNGSGATAKSTEAFYSGEVTWLLNGESSDGAWKQTLNGESLPGFSGEQVYLQKVYNCAGTVVEQFYTNTPGGGTIPDHTLDENGLCTACGFQCEALVTIGGQTWGFATFQEALTKAQEGTAENRALVKVCVDLNTDVDWEFIFVPPMITLSMKGGYATLDLNGHVVYYYSEKGLDITGTNLVIRDSSQAQTGQLYNWGEYGVYADQGSYVELQSGTVGSYQNKSGIYLGNGSEALQTGGMLLGQVRALKSHYTMQGGEILSSAMGVHVDAGTVAIQDGTITAGTWLFVTDGAESMTITGGTFATSNGINIIEVDSQAANPNISIQGGTFLGGVKAIQNDGIPLAPLLAEGYCFHQDETYVNLTENQSSITGNVTVAQAPIYIYTQPQDVTMQSTDAGRISIQARMFASGGTISYEWFREGEAEAVRTGNMLELVALEPGTHRYYCVATHTATGYQLQSRTATVTVTQCSHSLDGNACCTLCGKQMAVSLTAGGSTTYYPQAWVALRKANETPDSLMTLLTNIDYEDWRTTITGTMTLDLNGKTWTLQEDYFDLYALQAYALSINGGTLTIRDSLGGGKLTSSDGDDTVRIAKTGKAILEGGTIENTAGKSAVYVVQSSFTQTGGAVVVTGGGNAIEAENSQLSLEGGSTQGDFAVQAASSTLSITGGTHTGVVLLYMSEGTITGGTFYPLALDGLNVSLIPHESSLAVSGGSFPQGIYATDYDGAPVPLASVLAEGYGFYQDGTYVNLTEGQSSITGNVTLGEIPVVVNVAAVTIGGTVTEYPTLQEAFDAAATATEANPATITLLEDVELLDNEPGFIWAAGVGSFDLNGHSVRRTAVYTNNNVESLIYVSGGILTILDKVGEGKISSDFHLTGGNTTSAVSLEGGTLILESGTLYCESNYALYLTGGTFRMNGGILRSEDDYASVICQEYDAQSVHVEIHSGTITGGMGMLLQGNAQVEITGGTIHGEVGLLLQSAGSLAITGGTFRCPSPADYGMLLWMPEVNATITGGTFETGFHANSVANESFVQLDLNTLLPQGYGFQKADGSWVTLTPGQTQITEAVTVGRIPEILSVSITWGELDFFYDSGTWNPDTLTYTGGEWKPIQSDGRTITVENTGNVAVNVTLAYTPAEGYGYISGSFMEAAACLPAQEQKKFYLELTGKPQTGMERTTLGTVTVTIGGE